MPRRPYEHWYLRIVAAIFAVLCGVSVIRYCWNDLSTSASVPAMTQLLCFLFTIGAIAYFIRPRLGHHAMLALALIVLLTHAHNAAREANAFWLMIVVVLAIPLFRTDSQLSS
jgi:hypothetical protein